MLRAFVLASKRAEQSALDALRAEFEVEVETAVTEDVTYHDTFDFRLLRRGETLDVRDEAGTPVTSWRSAASGLLHRLPGRTVPAFAGELPDGPFRRALAKRTGVRRLLPQLRCRLHARRVHIVDRRGKTVARAIFERGTADGLGAGASRRRLPATLTVVGLRGYDDDAERVAGFLASTIGLAAAPACPLTRALQVTGDLPRILAAGKGVEIRGELTAGQAVRRILQAQRRVLETNEGGIREDLDTEFLHDYRVAVRRSRAAMGQLKRVFAGERFDGFRDELKWLGGSTGGLRDLDVYLLTMPDYRKLVPRDLRPGLDPLERHLRVSRDAELARVVELLGSRRYRTLLAEWSAFLESDEGCGPDAAKPVSRVAAARIRRAFRRAVAAGELIDAATPPAALHELRIECKKLRYLLEFFRDLYPEAAGLVKHLKRLQDNLGRFNDLDVQRQTLGTIAERLEPAERSSEDTLLAVQALIERLDVEQVAERRRFDKRFAAFASQSNRELARRLFSPKGARP